MEGDQAPSLDTVFAALHALYHTPDASGKEQASAWLEQLQHSVHAWTIADQLLQLNHDVESCYFAAQTMRSKIQYAFQELPEDSHLSLRDSLMAHAAKITAESPPVIATQLSLALADLALQMATWNCACSEMVYRFSSDPCHLSFLIELLTVMPEEVNSRSLRLGENRRQEITAELKAAAPNVLNVLTNALTTAGQDSRLQARALRCLASWFAGGAVPNDAIVKSPLLRAPFQALLDTKCPAHLHEAAADCVCAAIHAAELRDPRDAEEKQELANSLLQLLLVTAEEKHDLANSLLQGVLMLPEAYHISVAMEDTDKSINYCRIFTELAEAFLDMIVVSPNQGFGDFRQLELLLTCAGHHQYELVHITFNFWYQLSEHLYRIDNQQLNDMFMPYYERLINALCKHCQYDPDHEGVPDDSDEFGDFRTRTSELIYDVVFIVGSTTCFKSMFNFLTSQSGATSWDVSEAALFVMTSVAKNILPDESEVVPQVLEAVLSLPDSAHIALRHTATRLVGELGEWVGHHPDTLERVLQFLMLGLQQSNLATPAASALQSVCQHCQNHMQKHLTGLMQIVQSLESFSLSQDGALGIIKGTALVLSKMSPVELKTGIIQLAQLQIQPLNSLLDQHEAAVAAAGDGKPAASLDPCVWLDRLAALFRSVQVPTSSIIGDDHPCIAAVQSIWPVVSRCCAAYAPSSRVTERCCRCLRFLVRSLGRGSMWLLHPLVTQMVELYTANLHSCWLYLGSILVDEYGRDDACIQGLLDMVLALATPAFHQLDGATKLRDHPDTVDDLTRLCLRFVQRSPGAFLARNDVADPILRCVIAACSLDHGDANTSVVKFLIEICRTARGADTTAGPAARQLLAAQGASLVNSVIRACVYSLRSHMIHDMAEVLYELMLVERPQVCSWLEVSVKALPRERSGGVITATEVQLTEFHGTVSNAQEAKIVSRAIRELSRLYR